MAEKKRINLLNKNLERLGKKLNLTLSPVEILRLPILDGVGYDDLHIPARNLLLITCAIIPALKKNLYDRINLFFPQVLELGPDKNSWFFSQVEKILRKSYKYDVKIHRPFCKMYKHELIKKSEVTKEMLETYTWGCYNNAILPCQLCLGCWKKLDAYKQLGWYDGDVPIPFREYVGLFKEYFSRVYLADFTTFLRMSTYIFTRKK